MEILLTKAACLVLAAAYAKYESRCKEGISSREAGQFQFLRELNCKATENLSHEDMEAALSELESHNLLKVYNLDFKLTAAGIALSEQQANVKHKSVLLWMKSILETTVGLIPLVTG